MTRPHWSPGETILWRYRRKVSGYVGPETVRPMTVVRDDADGLVAWLSSGAPVLRPVLPDGRELRAVAATEMFRQGRALARDRWRGTGVLKIAPTGMPWSVWLFWEPDWSFRGWYVNLEDVHERETSSIVTQDHVLDLWVTPDRAVHWKDEDELAAAVETGRWSAAEAERFRADARAVEQLVGEWAAPFRDGWERWRPDASLPVPALPFDARWDFDLDERRG
jgi:predicted RNA-binding protein associated with RNAse of E/G family